MGIVINHRHIELVTKERRRNYIKTEVLMSKHCLFRTFNTRVKQNIDTLVLALLCKTKI